MKMMKRLKNIRKNYYRSQAPGKKEKKFFLRGVISPEIFGYQIYDRIEGVELALSIEGYI